MSQSSTKPKKLYRSSKLKESKIKKLPLDESTGTKESIKSPKKKAPQTPKKNASPSSKKKKNRAKKSNKKKLYKQKRKSRRGRKRSLSQEVFPIPQLEPKNEKRSKKKKKKTRKRIKKKKSKKNLTQSQSNTEVNTNQNENNSEIPNGVQTKNTKQPLWAKKTIHISNSYTETKSKTRQNNKKMNKYGLIQKKKLRSNQKNKLFRGFSMDFKHYRKNKKNQNQNLRRFTVKKEKEFEEFLNQKGNKKIRDYKSESKSEYNIYPILNSIDLNEYAEKNFSPKKKRLLRRKNKPLHSQLNYSPQKLQSPILKFDESKDSKLAVDLFEYLLYFMGEKKYVKKFKKKSSTSLSNTTNINTTTPKTKTKMKTKMKTKTKTKTKAKAKTKTKTATAATTTTTTKPSSKTKQNKQTEVVTNNTNTNNKTTSRQLPIKANKQFEQNDAIKKIIKVGLTNKNLRDEIYIQICKQTTNNPNLHSNLRAWGALCLVTQSFPPSEKLSIVMIQLFESYNQSKDKFIRRYAKYAQIKLESIKSKKSGFLIPTDEMIRRIFAVPYDPIIFNVTLEDCMLSQKKFYPNEIIPYIIIYLIKKIKQTGGFAKEGLFRVPGNTQKTYELKDMLDRGTYDEQIEDPEMNHPFVYASLLKLWIRELYEPLIPIKFYQQILNQELDTEGIIQIIERLPALNKLSLAYVISLFQEMQNDSILKVTKMNIENLVLMFAPNIIKFKYDHKDLFLYQKMSQKQKKIISELILNWDVKPYLLQIENKNLLSKNENENENVNENENENEN
ncbi:rho gtpase activation protein [Anaeramoeba flamelloides]|uniref:Rho gtpase activation protein n=1 Tax=Anaeramoeba flamelloides TaxID=1746091 RepID=A0AAV7ZND7_9EUKA|nr:rho gtpase activation protein [Anaeramoeba flamelloides]